MLGDQIVEFKRIGNAVQLIAKNYAFTGRANAPIAQGVKEGFTDSLLGATSVVSLPHPERKTVLVDANSLLLTDIPVGERFTTGIHMRNYTFDAKNSSFEAVRNSADQSSFVVSAHYQNARATLPPSPTATAPNPFPPFTTLPDGAQPLPRLHATTSRSCPSRWPRAARILASDISQSQVWDFSDRLEVHAPGLTTSLAGGSRRRIPKRRSRSRRSRSSSGSTAPSPRSTAPRCATASSSGTRRSRRPASRTRSS